MPHNQSSSLNLRQTVFISLFTALIIIGGYISFPIPFSPVPIVLSDFFVMLTGLTLGASAGAASIGMFLFLGALGLPVFAGGKAGLAVMLGPTGGFLAGYLIGGWLVGLISGGKSNNFIKDLVALISGNIILFGLGLTWLKLLLKVPWDKALALGLLPFLVSNAVKTIAALLLVQVIRPLVKQHLQ